MFTSVQSRSINAYKRVNAESNVALADPHKLVELLFESLLNNLGAAVSALERGDVKAKCEHIVIAVRILEEGLRSSLNTADGGDLAANLSLVYDFCVTRLTQANLSNDAAKMDEVRRVILPIADGWRQIADQAKELP